MPELIPAEPGTPDWLAVRRGGVTATDIVTICGLSAWDSAYALYWRKTGQAPEPPDNDRFRLGRELEPYVVSRWCDERHIPPAHREGARSALYRSDARPWQLATPDRLFYDEPLEVKMWADADRHTWADGPPASVRAQVLWQMDVMDVATGHVGVVFLPSGEFRSYVIEGCGDRGEADDCDFCKDTLLMRDRGHEFYRRLTCELPPPDVDGSAASLAALKARFGDVHKTKTAPVDRDLWNIYLEDCEALDAMARTKRASESLIREQVGEAGAIEVDGQLVARHLVYESQVKAHTRRVDMIRRVKNGDDSE